MLMNENYLKLKSILTRSKYDNNIVCFEEKLGKKILRHINSCSPKQSKD